MRLFVSRDDRIIGPFSPKEAGDRIALGLLSPLDEAWWDLYPDEVAELRELLQDIRQDETYGDQDEAVSLSTSGDPYEEEEDDEEDEGDDEPDPFDAGETWEEDVWQGNPSLFAYPKTLVGVFAMLTIGAASFWLGWMEWIGFALLGGGCFTAALLSVTRSTHRYIVTSDHIEHSYGLLRKYSLEMDIDAIRIINVQQPGFLGLFGLGNIAFDDVEGNRIVFGGIWRPLKLKHTIRDLQQSETDALH